jgi:hypothetical protein
MPYFKLSSECLRNIEPDVTDADHIAFRDEAGQISGMNAADAAHPDHADIQAVAHKGPEPAPGVCC